MILLTEAKETRDFIDMITAESFSPYLEIYIDAGIEYTKIEVYNKNRKKYTTEELYNIIVVRNSLNQHYESQQTESN